MVNFTFRAMNFRTAFKQCLLSYVQTDATTPDNGGSCYVRSHVGKGLTGFKLCTTTPDNRQHATTYNRVCKQDAFVEIKTAKCGKLNIYISIYYNNVL